MPSQGILKEKASRSVKMAVGDKAGNAPSLKSKGIISVAPHVRMVRGRAVFVAGYTYRRK